MSKFKATLEQQDILNNNKKNLIVSASAGSGKTTVLVEYIRKLIVEEKVPIKKLLVLTFTNVAGQEMKERLLKALAQEKQTKFLLEQIDDLPTADICTIDSFCEKVIKRNIDKLELDECFSVMDEGQSKKLKAQAFQEATNEFVVGNFQDYSYIYTSFKKNKNAIFECLCYIENFLDSLSDSDKLIDKVLNNQEEIFVEASDILNNHYRNLLDGCTQEIASLNFAGADDKYINFINSLKNIIESLNKSTLQDKCNVANNITIPSLPIVKSEVRDEVLAEKISSLKEEVKKVVESLSKFDFEDKNLLISQKEGRLAKAIIKLYKVYKQTYQKAKQENDLLDFADIERLCAQLLEDDEILKGLQEGFLYTFIDEYQDTNFLQENIIKKIAGLGNFVGVGDPKQAIYGFRNATMEIMKRDIGQNLASQDGNVVFLRGNFRSDKRVLDFVNSIFAVLMKEENTGIDYLQTSMLDGKANYYINADKAVEVCFVHDSGEERKELQEVYSVKDADVIEKDNDMLEAQTICAKIDELLTKQIYDIKQERWRDVELDDIVVLMRGRGSLMQTLANQLQAKDIPVIADDKEALTDDAEIQMLISLLKYCLDEDDTLSFISLLLSKLGNMGLDEITKVVCNLQEGQDLLQTLKKLENEKVISLLNNIETFKTQSLLFGIRRAYELLFDRTFYFAYLKTLGEEKVQKVEKFLSTISQSGFDFSIASLLSYLSNLSSSKTAGQESVGNAVNIMTIHGSKGMEFPIVILAGCGKNLTSPNKSPFAITERLGLATMEYVDKNLIKVRTPQLEASRLLKRQSEYIDELMIFYVALTRAKNKLILTGTYDAQDFPFGDSSDFFKGRCYFDWLMMSLSQSHKNNVMHCESYENDLAKFIKVDKVVDLQTVERENLIVEEDASLTKKINEYLDFVYENLNLTKVEFKNSVTGLLKLQIDDKVEEEDFGATTANQSNGFSASEIGTIYHEVLKLIDFSEINSLENLKVKIDDLVNDGYLLEEEKNILDLNILFKDIEILKEITKNKQIFKEKPFIMKINLNEILDIKYNNKVLVQGVVDMFALGKENILVDYKFTNIKNKEKLLQKYFKQLSLYSKAIEKAYKIKLNKKYIFSIKNAQLIEFFE